MSGPPGSGSHDGAARTAPARARRPLWLPALAGAFVLFLAALVASSLHRPRPLTRAPDPSGVPAGDPSDTAAVVVTLDARDPERWVYLDVSRALPLAGPEPPDWDLAFRRFELRVNGDTADGTTDGKGEVAAGSVPGAGGGEGARLLVLEPGPARHELEVPGPGPASGTRSEGEEGKEEDVGKWYRYDFLAHLLFPEERLYGLRTVEGHFALLRFESYYCPGPVAGCVTLRYRYREDGGRSFPPLPPRPGHEPLSPTSPSP